MTTERAIDPERGLGAPSSPDPLLSHPRTLQGPQIATRSRMSLTPADLIQVQAADERWHAAAIGPGILCPVARDEVSRTLAWDQGTNLVNCPDCMLRLAALRKASA